MAAASANPVYKITADCVIGFPRRAGEELEFCGWPPDAAVSAMLPLNEQAKRVLQYAGLHRFDPFKLDTPFCPLTGKLYLPATTPTFSDRLPAGLREGDAALPGMPRYSGSFVYRGRHIEAPYCWLGWPLACMAAANAAAEQVMAYWSQHRAHPKIPVSPWNEATEEMHLPELPDRKTGKMAESSAPRVSAPPVTTAPYRGSGGVQRRG